MSKTKSAPAAQAQGEQIAEDPKQGAVEVQAAAEAAADADQAADAGEQATGTDQPPQSDELPADQNPPVAGETVPALVLHDSVYGKCGEVKQFPADTVEAIAAAGYIDLHPNAVKSAKG